MALQTCPECGRELSSQAAACPHCGYTRARDVRTAEGCGSAMTKTGKTLTCCITIPVLLLLAFILFTMCAPIQ